MSMRRQRRQVPWARRMRRWATVLLTVGALGLVVPDGGPHPVDGVLVAVDSGSGVDTTPGVTWILALGSDARPGEPVLRSRSDAIHLVGFNPSTGSATIIGIPRDSYVDIPGHGRDKINAAMVYGGPQLTAEAVAGLVGIRPDYVFTTSFWGFSRMVWILGGVDVYSPDAFSEKLATIHRGYNKLGPVESLVFVRERHQLPNGDFDRSRNQGQFMVDGLRRTLRVTQDPGGLEQLLWTFSQQTQVDIGPVALYRLGRAVLQVDPAKVVNCVLRGSTGLVGSASVVFPDVAQARSLGRQAAQDATLRHGCG